MGRWATYPTSIEDLKYISIADLKRMKLLTPESFVNTVINWTNQNTNEKTGSISVNITTNNHRGQITFDYTYRETEKINYTARLITRPSNLGKGLQWFFVCPSTGKVCRKLHLINGYFKHRSALPGLMYQKQIESKKWRYWNTIFANEFNDAIYTELYSKYFKRYYNGKMTKRFARISKKLQEMENNFNADEYLKLFKR